MVWQDLLIALANILFSYSLINQVHHGYKYKRGFIHFRTAILTTIGLMLSSIAFFSLRLYTSAGIIFFNGLMWTILSIQRVIYKKA